MSSARPSPLLDWSAAQAHLSRVDPVMARLIKTHGPCGLIARRPHFTALCQSIFSQQISGAVAKVLFDRFRAHFPRRAPTAAATLKLSDEQLRAVGLSRQKMLYVRDLAAHFADGRITTRGFSRMGDEEIIQALTAVHGIGRWTAEMFLMFVLNRPDVFPIDDLGIQKGVQRAYGLKEMPKGKKLLALGEPFRPWRTIASWYFWRTLDKPAAAKAPPSPAI